MIQPEFWALYSSLIVFGAAAAVILVCGVAVTVQAEHLARYTGLGQAITGDAGDTTRKRSISEMRQLLACTHSTAFSNYAGQKVEWLQPRWSDDRDYVEIRVRILQNGESPVPVAYRLWKNNGQWKRYDLVVEGVSLMANYRSTFSQRLQEHDLDALIDELAAHNAQRCGSGG